MLGSRSSPAGRRRADHTVDTSSTDESLEFLNLEHRGQTMTREAIKVQHENLDGNAIIREIKENHENLGNHELKAVFRIIIFQTTDSAVEHPQPHELQGQTLRKLFSAGTQDFRSLCTEISLFKRKAGGGTPQTASDRVSGRASVRVPVRASVRKADQTKRLNRKPS